MRGNGVGGTLAGRALGHAAGRGDEVAFRFLGRAGAPGDDITWARLVDAAKSGAQVLRAAGLEDCRIGLLCGGSRDFVVALMAVFFAGGIAVPMPATLNRRSAPRVSAIAAAAELAGIIASEAAFAADWLGDAVPGPDLQRVAVESLAGGDATAFDADRLRGDVARAALIQFTSGSTGSPQGIVLSHANILANCAAIAAAYDLDARDIGLSWLPLHHDMGLVGHVLMPIWIGGRSVLMNPLRFLQKPLSWLEAIGRERATITSGPNFAYELCNRAAPADLLDFDLGSLTTAICGGEPVLPATLDAFSRRFAARGFRPSAWAPSYGLAEATLLVSTGKRPGGPNVRRLSGGSASEAKRSSVDLGKPVAGMRVRIVDPATGGELRDGETGEIEIAGSSVGHRLGEEQRVWTRTGDLGVLADGSVLVAGRIKETLILRGQNVFAADAEAAALAAGDCVVPGGVAAIGVERDGTQAMVLVAELRARRATSNESLRHLLREAVAAKVGSVPQDVVFVKAGTLPRTSSGKLRRAEIAQQYAAGALSTVAPGPTPMPEGLVLHA